MYGWNEEEVPWQDRVSSESPMEDAGAETQRLKSSAVAATLKCHVKSSYDSKNAFVVAHPKSDDEVADEEEHESPAADFGGGSEDEDDTQLEPAVAIRSDNMPTPKCKATTPSTPPPQKSIGAPRLRGKARSRGRQRVKLEPAPGQ